MTELPCVILSNTSPLRGHCCYPKELLMNSHKQWSICCVICCMQARDDRLEHMSTDMYQSTSTTRR